MEHNQQLHYQQRQQNRDIRLIDGIQQLLKEQEYEVYEIHTHHQQV
jgi:hypothetical protein